MAKKNKIENNGGWQSRRSKKCVFPKTFFFPFPFAKWAEYFFIVRHWYFALTKPKEEREEKKVRVFIWENWRSFETHLYKPSFFPVAKIIFIEHASLPLRTIRFANFRRRRCKFVQSSEKKKRDEKKNCTNIIYGESGAISNGYTQIFAKLFDSFHAVYLFTIVTFFLSFVTLSSFNRFSQRGIYVNIIASISFTVVYFFLALDRDWLQCASWSGIRWPSSIHNARRSLFKDKVVGWKPTWMNSKITRLAWESENKACATQFLNSPRQNGQNKTPSYDIKNRKRVEGEEV